MTDNEALENWLKLWEDVPDLEFDRGINARLIQRFLGLGMERNAQILFPLCGKAHSMMALARLGYRIAGIEISPVAIKRFFSEHGLIYRQAMRKNTPVYFSDEFSIELYCEDMLKGLALGCQAFFDVAALVAILPGQRIQYVSTLKSMLAPRAKGIVAVMQYEGPALTAPFPVFRKELDALFSDSFEIIEVEKFEARVHPAHPLAARNLEGIIYALERIN